MEIRTIVQRHERYYMIVTVSHLGGDYPYETRIVLADENAVEPPRPVYTCFYETLSFATKGHDNLVKLWPGP